MIEPIIVEQTFRAPIEPVWRAITDPEQMRKWFFEPIAEFRPESGFATRFVVRSGDIEYPHLWRVTQAIAPTRLVYEWSYEGFPGESFVAWDLAETSDGTRLRLTHTGIDSFPQDNPAFTRKSCEAGWNWFLCDRLKAFLEHHP
jgi:uncharacterized protein YndB with AHSA1/START domain